MGFLQRVLNLVPTPEERLRAGIKADVQEAFRTGTPVFDSSSFGFSPMIRKEGGETKIKCDVCGKYKPAKEVCISPGDGFAECEDCV